MRIVISFGLLALCSVAAAAFDGPGELPDSGRPEPTTAAAAMIENLGSTTAPLRAAPLSAEALARPLNRADGDIAAPPPGPDARAALLDLFAAGIERDLAPAHQRITLRRYLELLDDPQFAQLTAVLQSAPSDVARILVLKSLLVGEPWEHVVAYANEMRGHSDEQIIARSTMRDELDLVQQWQDSCGPAMLQTACGESDPRYAWELNKLCDLTLIEPLGRSAPIAQQQKDWLEKFGGKAVPRGEVGTPIPISEFLNTTLAPVVGVRYVCIATAGQLDGSLERISAALVDGYDVPLCIAWDDAGSRNHFVIALAVRVEDEGGRAYLIHDSWTGRTTWVSERDIRSNRVPIFGENYARLSHYYDPQPRQQ